jgi:tRNA/rRNA methyltransferase/tRNA (cytidine32/uridine32-2'-O)-methyltransferase
MRAEEIDRCHDLSVIPSDAAQPSFNLAQAVLLYAYELQLAAGPTLVTTQEAPLPASATDEQLQVLHDSLGQLLTRGNFLRDGRDALQQLFVPLRRAKLSAKEAALWTAAVSSVAKRLPGTGPEESDPQPGSGE